jgi:hypothetical protein
MKLWNIATTHEDCISCEEATDLAVELAEQNATGEATYSMMLFRPHDVPAATTLPATHVAAVKRVPHVATVMKNG